MSGTGARKGQQQFGRDVDRASAASTRPPARDDKGKDVSFDAESDDETLQVADYRHIDLEKGDEDEDEGDDINQRLLAAGGPSTQASASASASASDSENDEINKGRGPAVNNREKEKKQKASDKGKKEKRETVRWRDLPEKGQLTVLTLARLSEPLVQTSLQSYMFYQLQSFRPDLPASTIASQSGILHASFTAAQFVTAMFWGRLADSPRFGRKTVLMIGLTGTSMYSRSFDILMFDGRVKKRKAHQD